jgi:FkbM family methyltransferase
MVFIDAGANQGEFTVFAAKRLPTGRVLAFEPMPEMYRRLTDNVVANGFANVRAIPEGLWSEPGPRQLFLCHDLFDDGSRNLGLGTLYKPAGQSVQVETITCTTLDAVMGAEQLTRVDVIKVDVEGSELEVLLGGEEMLQRHKPVLLVEADRGQTGATRGLDRLLDFLAGSYRLSVITRSGKTRPLVRATMRPHEDLLCEPK